MQVEVRGWFPEPEGVLKPCAPLGSPFCGSVWLMTQELWSILQLLRPQLEVFRHALPRASHFSPPLVGDVNSWTPINNSLELYLEEMKNNPYSDNHNNY